MTQTNGTLARLRKERDHALALAMNRLYNAGQRVKDLDSNVKSLTAAHPVVGLGCAAAAGAMAGLLMGGQPIRNLARLTALAIARPVAVDLIHKLLGSLEANWNNPG